MSVLHLSLYSELLQNIRPTQAESRIYETTGEWV